MVEKQNKQNKLTKS